MTVNELMYDALKYDEPLLAYSVFWSIKKGLCKAHDHVKLFKAELVNQEEVYELIKQNALGMKSFNLYSMPTTPGHHLIVFAESEASAKGHYLNEKGVLPKKIYDMTSKLDTSFWYGKERGYKTFREVRDETIMFPSTVMEYDKTTKTMEEIEYEYSNYQRKFR